MKKTKEQYDDRVIEARWDFEQQAWRFMRIRSDKFDANHINVVESIIKTIIEPVHQKDVCAPLARLAPSITPPLLRTSEWGSDSIIYYVAHRSRASHPNPLEGACGGPSPSKPSAFPITSPLELPPTARVPAVLPASTLQPPNSKVAFPWCTVLSRGVHRRWVRKSLGTSGRGWVYPLVRRQAHVYYRQQVKDAHIFVVTVLVSWPNLISTDYTFAPKDIDHIWPACIL